MKIIIEMTLGVEQIYYICNLIVDSQIPTFYKETFS